MNHDLENNLVDSYFKILRNWDNESKKNLIIQLTQSIGSNFENKGDFSQCFGAWDDERSAKEIVEEIRADRISNSELEDF